MKKTMLHSAIAAVIATFAVASYAAVIPVDGTQKPITDTTIGGLVVQNGGSAVVDADGKDVSFNKEANFKTTKGETIYVGARLIGQQDKIASLTINVSMLNFASLSANKSNDGLNNFVGWQDGYSSLTINAGEITIGSAEKGGDRGFQFKNDYNTLEVHADKVVAYVLDGLINAQGTAGHSSATFGTASDRIGHFEAHTTYGKDDYGVALLQVNEGNNVSLYAENAILDGSTNAAGGVVGSGGWGTANIDVAKTLKIDGNLCGTYGLLKDKEGENKHKNSIFAMNIKAGKLEMKGDVNAGSIGSGKSKHDRTTIVNINAGEGSLIEGDFNVYERGNTAATGALTIDGDINVKGGGNVLLGGRFDGTVGENGVEVTETYGGSITIDGEHAITIEKGSVTIGGTLTALDTVLKSGQVAAVAEEAAATPQFTVVENAVAYLKSVDNVGTVELENNSVLKVTEESTIGTITTAEDAVSTVHLAGNATGKFTTVTGDTNIAFDSLDNKATIGTVTEGSTITSQGSAVFNEQYASAEAAAQAAVKAGMVVDNNGDVAADRIVVVESESNGSFSADITEDDDGNSIIDQSTVSKTLNSKTERFGKSVAQNIYAWRLEMNDMNKRLGELRDSEGNTGVWARVNAGKQKADGSKNDFTQFQFGVDTKVEALANIHAGLAFSYTDSDLEYIGGEGDNKIFGLAAYGSWLGDNGSFVDVIAKVARLESDSVIDGTSGDFNTTAYSLSAEVGHRFDLAESVFLEPQAEMSWGYVDGKTFTTLNKTSSIATDTTVDSTTSLIGRLGVRAGIKCPNNKGTAYVRTSILHEFDGDVSVTRGDGTYTEDASDTWFEYAIGGNYNLSSTTQFYADLSRTSNAELSEPWRLNVGARWAF